MSQYYKKYMKKREEEKPSYAKLFVGAFLMMMVFFVILANSLTSSVDTSIGENDEGDIKESGLGVKHLIDSRLRFIKMEDESAVVQTKEKPANIEEYNKTIQEEAKSGYSGNLQNSYGYDSTQETKPYSQTYSGVNNEVNSPSKPVAKPAQTASKQTAPMPLKPVSPSASTPAAKTYTPTHNIQKNLAPTGMN
jgi:hypothetical protein